MELTRHIRSFLDARGITRCYEGFSGGLDSTALLLLLHEAGVQVTAVHFQHGIRGDDAEADAVWCRDFCERRGIAFILIRLNVPERLIAGESVEEGARRLRLESWKTLASRQSLPVFLAHHADDALEELFLRMARGSNATGLTSIRDSRTVDGITLLRPLAGIRKDRLKDYLLQHGVQDWRTDATNADCHYRRNAVRNRLLPLFREIFGTDVGLEQSLSALRTDADFLEDAARKAFAGLSSIQDWQALHPALLPRVFRLWRAAQCGHDDAPVRSFTAALGKAIGQFDGHAVTVQLNSVEAVRISPRGLRLIEQYGSAPTADTLFQETPWDWQSQPRLNLPKLSMTLEALGSDGTVPSQAVDGDRHESFDADVLPPLLTVRPWRPGDRMVPFGHSSAKKLQDLFTDARVPRGSRWRYPVICADDTIIWVPGVRRAEIGRITDATRQTVTLKIVPKP